MLSYHLRTAYDRGALGGHMLDWAHQPNPFKLYGQREPQPLAQPRWPQAAFFDLARTWPPPVPPAQAAPDVADLSAILLQSAGITARAGAGGDATGLRAPASAGALYPVELYFTACGVEGLADGLYHFSPQGPGLHRLWPGPLAAAAARLLGQAPSGLTFFLSAMFWRSLWKYRTRAWRYCLLDAGHMLANLELACAAQGLAPLTCLDFPDSSAGVFLGLANQEEMALAALQAGAPPADPGPEQPGLPPLDRQAKPLSARIGRDPQVLEAAQAGALTAPAQATRWQAPPASGDALVLPPAQPGGLTFHQVAWTRRSARNFIPASLAPGQLPRLLAAACPVDGPFLATALVGDCPEAPPGAYLYLPSARALAPTQNGGQGKAAVANASLGQMWVGQASLVLILWADLERLEEIAGPRAYRHAMIAAGRAGQRLYLAATALGLGCCGVGAFYDHELAEAANLPPRAQALYLLACGPIKR